MAKHGRPQIIEVIQVEPARPGPAPTALEGATLGGGAPPVPSSRGADHDAARPRTRRWWIAPAVITAITAVIVGASVASDSGSQRATPTRGATATTTGPTTPPVLPLIPQTPTGYAIQSVTASSVDATTPPVRELWATHSTSLTSSWVEITAAAAADAGDWYHTDGDLRIAVPAGIAVLDGQPDGLLTISGPITGGVATIASSGVSRATIGELFASMALDGGALVHDDPRLGGMFQEVTADPGATRDPAAGTFAGSGATLTVVYAAIDDTVERQHDFDVTIGPVPAGYDELARRFFLSHSTEVVVNGQRAVIGNDERTFGTQSVAFQRAGLQVSIEGSAPRSVLLDAVQSVHVATGIELAALMAIPPASAGLATAPPQWVPFGSGTLASGQPWTLRAGVAAGNVVALELGSPHDTVQTAVDGRDSIIVTLASPAYTALVAYVPRDVAGTGTHLVVTVDGEQHSVEPVDVGGGELLAGFAFDQLSTYTAQIVGADGHSLSSTAG